MKNILNEINFVAVKNSIHNQKGYVYTDLKIDVKKLNIKDFTITLSKIMHENIGYRLTGFIGYSISMFLLKKKYKVFGIDNYSLITMLELKKSIRIIKFSNFRFNKIDLNNSKIK